MQSYDYYVSSRSSTLKFLDAVIHLAWRKCKRNDARDVHLWAENVHVQLELASDGLDVLETFLVVGSGTTNPDLHLVFNEEWGDFSKGTNDTLECGGDLL